MPSTWWTDDRTAALHRLFEARLSFAQIAAEIGDGATRNAICGKIHRLGLNGASSSIRVYHRKTPEQIAATKRDKMNRRNERRRSQPITIRPKLTVTNLEALRCVEVQSLGKTLLELGPNDCRYPFGDGPYTFCGHPQFEGSSYCGAHFGLSARRGQNDQS